MKIVKIVFSTLVLTFVLTLFLGCFNNTPDDANAPFRGEYWLFLNRGYPEPWAGVVLMGTNVDFPLIKMPLLYDDAGRGVELAKVVNVYKMMPTFLVSLFVVFCISIFPNMLLVEAMEKDRRLISVWVLLNLFSIGALFYIYFYVFYAI